MPDDDNADCDPPQSTYDRWAYERAVRESDLPVNARLLALTLASTLPTKSNRRNRMKAGEGQRLIETLVRETGLSRASVKRALNKLEAAGFVARIAQSGRRGRRASIFRLIVPAKAHLEPLGEAHPEPLRPAHPEPLRPAHPEPQYRVLEGGRSRGLNAEAERALREARTVPPAA